MNENNEFLQKSKKMLKKPSNEASNSNVPDFIQKLFRMLENKEFHNVFSWDPSGTSFLVKDTNEFSKSILPKHFKHCNFASFVRQLNKYDFHKVRNTVDENQKLYGDQVWEFEHSHFRRDRKDLLEEIKRKTPGKKKKTETTAENVDSSNNVIDSTEDTLVDSSILDELRKLTENLQSQVNELKKSQLDLETTVHHLNQKEKLIMAELSGFNESLKAKDAIIQECLKLTQQQQPQPQQPFANSTTAPTQQQSFAPVQPQQQQQPFATPANVNTPSSMDEKNIKIEPKLNWEQPPLPPQPTASNNNSMDNILTDIFLPSQQNVNTAKITETQPFLPLVPPDMPKPSTTAAAKEDKGKKKIQANWSTPPRVLLVDDDSLYRDVSGRMLNMMGCSINLAKDGLEALQKLSVEKYDLILMDIVMPKMDGIATTRNIRRYDTLTPIVSMTSNFSHNDIMEYIGIGMNDILPKPFSKNTLFDILEKHCAHLKVNSSSTTKPNEPLIPEQQPQPQQQQPQQQQQQPSTAFAYNNTNNLSIPSIPVTSIITNTSTTALHSNASSSSSTSTPLNNSPTIAIQDSNSNYWMEKQKLVWANNSNSSESNPPKRQKLNDLYDSAQPY